jgi:hypothetical protein
MWNKKMHSGYKEFIKQWKKFEGRRLGLCADMEHEDGNQ